MAGKNDKTVDKTDKTAGYMTAAQHLALARFDAELRADATPQTLRRLCRCAVDVWLQEGRIGAEQHHCRR